MQGSIPSVKFHAQESMAFLNTKKEYNVFKYKNKYYHLFILCKADHGSTQPPGYV